MRNQSINATHSDAMFVAYSLWCTLCVLSVSVDVMHDKQADRDLRVRGRRRRTRKHQSWQNENGANGILCEECCYSQKLGSRYMEATENERTTQRAGNSHQSSIIRLKNKNKSYPSYHSSYASIHLAIVERKY